MIVSHSYSGFMRNNNLHHKQNYLTPTLHSAFADLTFRARIFFKQKVNKLWCDDGKGERNFF